MKKQEFEKNVEILCTCCTLECLNAQKDRLQNGEPLNPTGKWDWFEDMFSDLTREELIETLEDAILCYDDEEFKNDRDDWWVDNDRDCDIQTLCICYSLECLENRRDELLRGEDNLEAIEFEVIKTAGIDVLNDAIADYNKEKYQRVRAQMEEDRKTMPILPAER